MNLSEQTPQNVISLVQGLLDKGYALATDRVIRSIVRDTNRGLMDTRLNDLAVEAQEAQDRGEKLNPNNPYVRALLADLEDILINNGRRINDASIDLQESSVTAAERLTKELALPGVSDEQFKAIVGTAWNKPSPETVNAFVNYTMKRSWDDELLKYTETNILTVKNQVMRGLLEGWSPTRTAKEIRKIVTALPAHQANNIMRTLQLQSYRTASVVNMEANSDILDGHIRIAALDDRTCMACIALHGTTLKISERVDDHHQGRCTSIPLVKGRPRTMQTGPEWFESLPEDRQIKIAGKARFDALKNGDIKWADIPAVYNDPTFGRMIKASSLKSLGIRTAKNSTPTFKTTPTGLPITRQAKDDAFYQSLETPAQFRKYFKDEYGIKLSVSRDTTIEGLREFARTFDSLATDYPQPLERLTEISIKPNKKMGNGVLGAAYHSGRKLEFNDRAINDIKKKLADIGGWTVDAENENAGTVTHEYGHLLHFALRDNRNEFPLSFKTIPHARLNDLLESAIYKLKGRSTEEDISRYAQANMYETFAEAFTAYRHVPEKKKSERIIEFENILRTLKVDKPSELFDLSDENAKSTNALTDEQKNQYNDVLTRLGIIQE